MSIQAECREAMNRLAAGGGTFTEFDVANEASGQGQKGWTAKLFEQAVRDAYNVLQGDYKRGRLVRYGPVKFQGIQDYARRGTKIVYAHPTKGPTIFNTPNGDFPRMHAEKDALARAGRRVGTNRDDTRPWEGQIVNQRRSGPPIDTAPLLRRISELEAEVARFKTNGNGNGNGHSSADKEMDQLVELLVDRLTPKVADGVKNSLAEALID